MKIEIIKCLIDYYFSILEEIGMVTFNASTTNIKRYINFRDNEEIRLKYYKELKEYFKSIKVDIDVIKFLLKNHYQLREEDIYYTLDALDMHGENKYTFIDNLIDNLDVSCDLQLEDKFYVPRKVFKYVDSKRFINIAKGFSMDSVKDFLLNESIYDEELLDSTLKKVKHFNLVGGDTKYIAGVFDKGIVLPRVRDDLTTLIAIHELVHYSILDKKYIIGDNNIVYSEILPRFYENLYASNNCFIKEVIHKDKYTDVLLKDYNNEPMLEQVEKVRRLINR